jgi:hypothetical protein
MSNKAKIILNVWQQTDCAPIHSPISNIPAQKFLQGTDNKHYPDKIKKRHIIFTTIYADVFLIIFNVLNTMAESILKDNSAMHHTLKYTIETKTNQQINFLDLNYVWKANELTLCIYRKPTYIDTVVPQSSNHPKNHKQAALNNLLDRAYKILITKDGRKKEIQQTNAIGTINGYNFNDITNYYKKHIKKHY